MEPNEKEYISEEIIIQDILPKEWFNENGEGDVYVSVYRCLTNILGETNKSHIIGHIFDVTYLIINTDLTYEHIDFVFKNYVDDKLELEQLVHDVHVGQHDFILLYSKNNPFDEVSTLSDLQTARGLMSNIEGKNSNFQHVYDFILHYPVGNSTTFSPAIKAPDKDMAFVEEPIVDLVSKKIDELEESLQKRIKLALRWIDSAEHEMQSIDEFLKLWFAIETISMPDTRDIKPLINRLSHIYNLDEAKTKEYFGIGIIFGLRSNIVHNGLNIGIHSQLNKFLNAIFHDLLLDICSLSSKYKAGQILNDPRFNRTEWMPQREQLK